MLCYIILLQTHPNISLKQIFSIEHAAHSVCVRARVRACVCVSKTTTRADRAESSKFQH